MRRHFAEIDERSIKRAARPVARVAPHLAIGLLRLLIDRCQQSTVVLPRQRLPVQIERTGQTRFARAFTATVLMHDDTA